MKYQIENLLHDGSTHRTIVRNKTFEKKGKDIWEDDLEQERRIQLSRVAGVENILCKNAQQDYCLPFWMFVQWNKMNQNRNSCKNHK